MSSSWVEYNSEEKKRKTLEQRTRIPSYDIRPSAYSPYSESGYNIQRLETDSESIEKYLEGDPSKALFTEAKSKKFAYKKSPRYAKVVSKGS